MNFKQWLKLDEVGTGSNAIALFTRPVGIGMVTRTSVDKIVFPDKDQDEYKDGPIMPKKKK
jgi:hypothetical protein